MSADALIKSYLDSLNSGDPSKILSNFADDGTVHSPLYGSRPAHEYFPEMLNSTKASETRLLDIFRSDDDHVAAMRFLYDWTLADGELVQFECVDVLTLTDDGERIKGLRIIYDTHPLRASFEKVRAEVDAPE